jgi:hypothetical protein
LPPAGDSGASVTGSRRLGSRRCRATIESNQFADGLTGYRADREPVLEPRSIQLDLRGAAQWIVDTDLFDEATVAWAATVGDNDSVEGKFFTASACETKSYGHSMGSWKNSRRKVLVPELSVKLRGVGFLR